MLAIDGVVYITGDEFEERTGVKVEENYHDPLLHFQMRPILGGFESIMWVPVNYLMVKGNEPKHRNEIQINP